MKKNLKQKNSNARIASYKYVKKIALTPKKVENQIVFLECYIQQFQYYGNGIWIKSGKCLCDEYHQDLIEATKNY